MNRKEAMTKQSDLWQTPDWLMAHFKNHFDPCPPNPTFDGLEIDWKDPTYCNPPYSNPEPWVKKAIEERKRGINVVMLLRVDPKHFRSTNDSNFVLVTTMTTVDFVPFLRRVKAIVT